MALLQVHELNKQFGAKKAVDGLSFQLEQGRCTALLGPNGAGKTTTLRMLAGLLTPTSGTITFEGRKGTDIRGAIGYLPQFPTFFNWMGGKEFLEFSGKLARLTSKEASERSIALLERVGLKDAVNRRIGGYSGGMRQRLGIAQAVIHRPRMLILDEPVSALDPLGRREILDLLHELKKETTILFSTHVLHDAGEVCDDVLIIREGKLAVSGDLNAVLRENRNPVITITTDGDRAAWLKSLADKPYVLNAEIGPSSAVLTVDNLEMARDRLLQEISGASIPITRFEVGQTTLEELFVKAVQE